MFLISVITYIWMEGEESYIFNKFHSLAALTTIFLVLKWKMAPDAPVYKEVLAKHLPGIGVIGISIASVIFSSLSDVILSILALGFSWLHLRFFHIGTDDFVGDVQPEFEFAAMFPPKMRPHLSAAGAVVLKVRIAALPHLDPPSSYSHTLTR